MESNHIQSPASRFSPSHFPVADFLEWKDAFEPQFDQLRAALERPYARMDGDYEHASACPIPNFVCVRAATQMLAQRAQCYLLMGEVGHGSP